MERHNPLKIIHNFFLCAKYPFYKVYTKNTNPKKKDKVTYRTTWYDAIPDGWRKAFGKQLNKDLKQVLKTHKQLKIFHIGDLKEKWGVLEIYPLTDTTSEIEAVLDKYKQLSMCYCINCGNPVRYRTKGWVSYLCEICFMKNVKNSKHSIQEVSKIYEESRLQRKNIPDPALVDFYKLWNIKK